MPEYELSFPDGSSYTVKSGRELSNSEIKRYIDQVRPKAATEPGSVEPFRPALPAGLADPRGAFAGATAGGSVGARTDPMAEFSAGQKKIFSSRKAQVASSQGARVGAGVGANRTKPRTSGYKRTYYGPKDRKFTEADIVEAATQGLSGVRVVNSKGVDAGVMPLADAMRHYGKPIQHSRLNALDDEQLYYSNYGQKFTAEEQAKLLIQSAQGRAEVGRALARNMDPTRSSNETVPIEDLPEIQRRLLATHPSTLAQGVIAAPFEQLKNLALREAPAFDTKDIRSGLDFTSYFIPGYGQARFGGDMVGAIINTAAKGPDAAIEFGKGLIESNDPRTVIGAINLIQSAIMVGQGAARINKSRAIEKLIHEHGVSREAATKAFAVVDQGIRMAGGRSVLHETMNALRVAITGPDGQTRSMAGKVATNLEAQGSAHLKESIARGGIPEGERTYLEGIAARLRKNAEVGANRAAWMPEQSNTQQVQKVPETASLSNTRQIEGLREINSLDERLALESPAYDAVLDQAMYRALRPHDDSWEPGSGSRILRDFELDQEQKGFENYDYEAEARITRELRGALKTGDGTQFVKWYRNKKSGYWIPDARQPVRAIAGDRFSVDAGMRLIEFAREWAPDDYVVISRDLHSTALRGTKSENGIGGWYSPPKGSLRPSEMFFREFDESSMTAYLMNEGVLPAESQVPVGLIRAYLRRYGVSLRGPERVEVASRLGLSDHELGAVIQQYERLLNEQREPRRDHRTTNQRGPDAEPRPVDRGTSETQEVEYDPWSDYEYDPLTDTDASRLDPLRLPRELAGDSDLRTRVGTVASAAQRRQEAATTKPRRRFMSDASKPVDNRTREQQVDDLAAIAARWAIQFGDKVPNVGEAALNHLLKAWDAPRELAEAAILRAELGFKSYAKEKAGDLFEASDQGSLFSKKTTAQTMADQTKVPADIDGFEARVDALRKISKGIGSNVYRDLKSMRAAGLYEHPTRKHRAGRIKINEALTTKEIAETLSHELGHALDSFLSRAAGHKATTGDLRVLLGLVHDGTTYRNWLKTDVGRALDAELREVTRLLEGDSVIAQDPKYFNNPKELWARFLQTVMFHPEIAREAAPTAMDHLLKLTENVPEIADYITLAKGGLIERNYKAFLGDLKQTYNKSFGRYLGTRAYQNEIVYRSARAKAFTDAKALVEQHMKGVKDRPDAIFEAAEGILRWETDAPVFGTRVYDSIEFPEGIDFDQFKAALQGTMSTDPKFNRRMNKLIAEFESKLNLGFRSTGLDANGNLGFERWRVSPDEGQIAWNALSPEGKRVVREFTAPLEEAKDVFNRERLKAEFDIQSNLEGWVHHYFPDAGPVVSQWKKMFLKERKASSRLKRTEAQGYSKDFGNATMKAIAELQIAKEWNDFVHKQMVLLAEPLPKGEEAPEGHRIIAGNVLVGFDLPGRRKLFTADGARVNAYKEYTVPGWVYDRYVDPVFKGMDEQLDTAMKITRGVARYYTTMILKAPASAATNIISGAIQFQGKMTMDFYRDIFTGQVSMPRTRANLMATLETLLPAGWRAAPDWVWGGDQTNFHGILMGQEPRSGLDKAVNLELPFYNFIERWWKKTIVNAERRMSADSDVLNDPEFISHVNDVVDLWAYDYSNIPLQLEQWRRNPYGSLAKPFMVYPYKLAKMYSRIAGQVLDGNLPASERMAALFTLGTIISTITLTKQALGGGSVSTMAQGLPDDFDDSQLEGAVNARGRVFVGKDREQNEVYLRGVKYPFVNAYQGIEAALQLDTKGMQDMVKDQIGGLGPLGELVSLNVFGLRDEYDRYKEASVINTETALSFVPYGRVLKGIADYMDPEVRKSATKPGEAVARYIPGMTDQRGPVKTYKLPYDPDVMDDDAVAIFKERYNLTTEQATDYVDSMNAAIKTQDGSNTTVEVPIPKDRGDILLRELTGVNMKRINPAWYGAAVQRKLENQVKRMIDDEDFEGALEFVKGIRLMGLQPVVAARAAELLYDAQAPAVLTNQLERLARKH